MTDRRDQGPLEDRLEAWLAGIPDAVPDRVAATATERTRSRRQRPAWLARVRQGSGFGRSARGPMPVLAATVAIVAHHPQAVYFGMKSGFIPAETAPDELIAGTDRGGALPPESDPAEGDAEPAATPELSR